METIGVRTRVCVCVCVGGGGGLYHKRQETVVSIHFGGSKACIIVLTSSLINKNSSKRFLSLSFVLDFSLPLA